MLFPVNMLYSYSAQGSIPDFVKSATIVEQEVKNLPNKSFADSERQYPIHTKAATWLSALKLFNNDLDDATETNIIKAAEFWGISDDLPKMSETVKATNVRPTLDDTDFAVVVKSSGETLERRFPLTGKEEIKEAAEELKKIANLYPLAIRRQAASRILKAATAKCVNLDNTDYLQKSAGLGVAEMVKVKHNLRYREKLARRTGAFNDLIEELGDKEVLHGELQEKVATALDTFDRETGVYKYYKDIATPEEICYSSTLKELEKRASALTLRDGTSLNMDKVKNAKVSKFAALGSDFMDSISDGDGNVDSEAFEAIVPTLPLDDTSILKRVL